MNKEKDEYYCERCEDAMFLTKKEWEEHIKKKHGIKKAESYPCMLGGSKC